MLRVYYSNQTEALLRALVDQIVSTRRSPFDPVRLVVPNRNMEVYVRLGVARLTGICANVEATTLRPFLDEASGRPETDARLLDGILSAFFDETFLAEPELAPVASYLNGDGDEGRGVDRRRVQLALELRRLFRTYEVSRPEILECWRAGLRFDDPSRRDVEAWQRHVWTRVHEKSAASVPEPEGGGHGRGLGPALLFGISYLARTDAEALARIAEERDVFVYTLNPCQEIWEAFKAPLDLPATGSASAPILPSRSSSEGTPRRYERRGSRLGPAEVFSVENPFRLSNRGELLPLRLWGRPARESLRLLNAVSGCELVPEIVVPRGESLLHNLQRDIVLRRSDRAAAPGAEAFAEDASVVFLECASARRELESVAAEIWSLLAEDDGGPAASSRGRLRFNDIAVLLVPSEAERYQSLVDSVFQEMHGIPFHIVDLPIRGESRLAEAASLLLALPLGRFGREEVLRFVTHPVVARSLPDADVGEWARACDRLGIYSGADRRDRKGSYVERDLFNWEQGLSRLALGVFAPEGSVFRRGDDAYLAAETSLEASRGLGSLALLVRSLLADAREASRVQMTLPAWADFLGALVSTYLHPLGESDRGVLDRCLAAIGKLAQAPLANRKVRYAVAHELVAQAIGALSGSRGAYLTDGVVVSSFLPMRAIPFRVIFVVGMGERGFPARDRDAYLDLSRAARRAGDVSRREEDKYLFLETLLSARERFYVSYVNRDERTGDPLSPSSLVLELKETLLASYVAPENLRVRQPPAARHEDNDTARCSPSAHAERTAWLVGRELREHLGDTSEAPPEETLPDGLRRFLSIVDLPEVDGSSTAPTARAHTRHVSLASLRRFLECPLQGAARTALRLEETDDDDRLWRAEEPLATTPLARAVLLRESLAGGGSDAHYQRLRETYELEGRVPTGSLGRSEARRHLELLRLYREGLESIAAGSVVTVREAPSVPILRLEGTPGFELTPSPELELLLGGRASIVRFVTESRSRFHARRESLRGFLRHLYEAASLPDDGDGEEGPTPSELFVLNARAGSIVVEGFRFDPVSRQEARSYLTSLAAEMLDEPHAYLLPCEWVFDAPSGSETDLDPMETSSRYGPVSDLEPYRPLEEERRRELVERRFGLYFRLCRQEESELT